MQCLRITNVKAKPFSIVNSSHDNEKYSKCNLFIEFKAN